MSVSYLELFHGVSLLQEIGVMELLFVVLEMSLGVKFVCCLFFGRLCVLWRRIDLRPLSGPASIYVRCSCSGCFCRVCVCVCVCVCVRESDWN